MGLIFISYSIDDNSAISVANNIFNALVIIGVRKNIFFSAYDYQSFQQFSESITCMIIIGNAGFYLQTRIDSNVSKLIIEIGDDNQTEGNIMPTDNIQLIKLEPGESISNDLILQIKKFIDCCSKNKAIENKELHRHATTTLTTTTIAIPESTSFTTYNNIGNTLSTTLNSTINDNNGNTTLPYDNLRTSSNTNPNNSQDPIEYEEITYTDNNYSSSSSSTSSPVLSITSSSTEFDPFFYKGHIDRLNDKLASIEAHKTDVQQLLQNLNTKIDYHVNFLTNNGEGIEVLFRIMHKYSEEIELQINICAILFILSKHEAYDMFLVKGIDTLLSSIKKISMTRDHRVFHENAIGIISDIVTKYSANVVPKLLSNSSYTDIAIMLLEFKGIQFFRVHCLQLLSVMLNSKEFPADHIGRTLLYIDDFIGGPFANVTTQILCLQCYKPIVLSLTNPSIINIIKILQNNTNNLDLLNEGIGLLCTLRETNKLQCIGDNDGIVMIINSLNNYPNDTNLHRNGLCILSKLSIDPKYGPNLINNFQLDYLISSVRNFITNSYIQQYGAVVLKGICRSASSNNLVQYGVTIIQHVLSVINQYTTNIHIQEPLSYVLSHFSNTYRNNESIHSLMANNETIEALLQGFKYGYSNPVLCTNVLNTIIGICDKRKFISIISNGNLENAVLYDMKYICKDTTNASENQYQFYRIMFQSMLHIHSDPFATIFGNIDSVMNMMEHATTIRNSKLLFQCFGILVNFQEHLINTKTQMHFLEKRSNSLQVIIDALKDSKNQSNETGILNILTILQKITEDNPRVETFIAHKHCAASILAIMNAFRNHSVIHKIGGELLARIVHASSSLKDIGIVTTNLIGTVSRSMNFFPNNQHIQLNGCIIIDQLISIVPNVYDMIRNNNIDIAICNAVDNFPSINTIQDYGRKVQQFIAQQTRLRYMANYNNSSSSPRLPSLSTTSLSNTNTLLTTSNHVPNTSSIVPSPPKKSKSTTTGHGSQNNYPSSTLQNKSPSAQSNSSHNYSSKHNKLAIATSNVSSKPSKRNGTSENEYNKVTNMKTKNAASENDTNRTKQDNTINARNSSSDKPKPLSGTPMGSSNIINIPTTNNKTDTPPLSVPKILSKRKREGTEVPITSTPKSVLETLSNYQPNNIHMETNSNDVNTINNHDNTSNVVSTTNNENENGPLIHHNSTIPILSTTMSNDSNISSTDTSALRMMNSNSTTSTIDSDTNTEIVNDENISLEVSNNTIILSSTNITSNTNNNCTPSDNYRNTEINNTNNEQTISPIRRKPTGADIVMPIDDEIVNTPPVMNRLNFEIENNRIIEETTSISPSSSPDPVSTTALAPLSTNINARDYDRNNYNNGSRRNNENIGSSQVKRPSYKIVMEENKVVIDLCSSDNEDDYDTELEC